MNYSAYYTIGFDKSEWRELESIFQNHPKWLARLEDSRGFLTTTNELENRWMTGVNDKWHSSVPVESGIPVYTNQDDSIYGYPGIWRQVSPVEQNKYPYRTYYFPDGTPIPPTGQGYTAYPSWTITGEPIRKDVNGREYQLIHNPHGPSGLQYVDPVPVVPTNPFRSTF